MSSQVKKLMKRILLFLVYGFAGAGVFTFLEKREETNNEKAKRLLQQLKNNFSMHQDITDEEFERFATALYEAIRVNKTLDWSYFRAVDFTYSALTTIGEFPFYMFTGETRPSRHWSLLLMNHNSIDLIHRWLPSHYSFVLVQISLPSLTLEQEFFSV